MCSFFFNKGSIVFFCHSTGEKSLTAKKEDIFGETETFGWQLLCKVVRKKSFLTVN